LQQKQGFSQQEVLHLRGKQNTAPKQLKLGGWVSAKTWLLGFPGLLRGPWWFNSGLGICPLLHPQRKKKWHWWLFKDMQQSQNSIFLSSRISAICRYICIRPPQVHSQNVVFLKLCCTLFQFLQTPHLIVNSVGTTDVFCATTLVHQLSMSTSHNLQTLTLLPLHCQSSCWIVLGTFSQTQHPR
jgi:hypothetical protein